MTASSKTSLNSKYFENCMVKYFEYKQSLQPSVIIPLLLPQFMIYNLAQAIGLNTDQEAALVVSAVDEKKNVFIAVLKLVSDDAFTKGRQILSEVEDSYEEDSETIAKKLTNAFELAKEKLKEVEKFDLCLATVSGKVLYIINEGSNATFLRRGDKLSNLTAIAPAGQVISGFLQEQDRLLFTTEGLVNFLGNEIGKNLSLPLDIWEDDTLNKITSMNADYSGLAALIVDAQPDVAQEIEKALQHTEIPVQSLNNLPVEKKLKERSVSPAALFAKVGNAFKNFRSKKTEESFETTSSPQAEVFKKDGFLTKILPKTKKARLIIGVLLIVVLLVGVGIQIKKGKDEETNKQFSAFLQTAQEDFNTAVGLQNLNPEETKAKLESAKSNLAKALSLKADNLEALEFKKKINEEEDKIMQQFAAAGMDLFLDLELIKSGMKANALSFSGTNLLILDPNSKTLVTIDISKKSNKILAGTQQLGNALLASINGSFSFVFSEDKGVVRVENGNQKVVNVAKTDEDLSSVVDIAGFASNVYVLDKANNQIWKYQPAGNGYAEKKEYLASAVEADFSKAIRMQIESSIYVLNEGGEILRFTKGNKDSFAISGLDKGVKNPKNFFTSSDVDNVYILDSGNSRLVVVDKAGKFVAQYQGDKFAVASDLVADEKGKKIYLLDNGKIYTTDLK